MTQIITEANSESIVISSKASRDFDGQNYAGHSFRSAGLQIDDKESDDGSKGQFLTGDNVDQVAVDASTNEPAADSVPVVAQNFEVFWNSI